MTLLQHWGKTIDTEVCTTGVFNISDVWHLADNIEIDGIDLDYEGFIAEGGDPDEYESYEPTIVLGFKKGDDGIYEEDHDARISAILNSDSNTIQIVHSRYKMRGTPCSPCYPGQCTPDENGDCWIYAPSKYDFDEMNNTIPEIFVHDIEAELRSVQEDRSSLFKNYFERTEFAELSDFRGSSNDHSLRERMWLNYVASMNQMNDYIDTLIIAQRADITVEQRVF